MIHVLHLRIDSSCHISGRVEGIRSARKMIDLTHVAMTSCCAISLSRSRENGVIVISRNRYKAATCAQVLVTTRMEFMSSRSRRSQICRKSSAGRVSMLLLQSKVNARAKAWCMSFAMGGITSKAYISTLGALGA